MGLLNNKLKDKKTIAVFFGLFIFVTLMGYQTKNSDLSSLYKSYIENQIAEVLGLTAEIGEFEIDWLDSSPLIIIDRLDLRRSDLQTNILLENLVLNISLSESFLNMQIIISDFSVDGISVGLNTFSGPNQLDVYGTLELEKSENFQRALLSFFDDKNRKVGDAIIEAQGTSLFSKSSEIQGYFRLSDINLPKLLFAEDQPNVNKDDNVFVSDLNLEVWFKASSQESLSFNAQVIAPKISGFGTYSNININDFMVRFDGSYDLESHWRFNFNELSFRGHDFEFASLGGFFESKYDSSQNVRYLFFESLDIENLSKFTEHSNLSQARFVKDLLDLNPRGKLDKFLYEEGQLDTKIKSSLVDFSMSAKNRIPGIKDLDAVINLNLNNKVLNLIVSDSNGLSINFPNLFSNPLYFGSMDGSLNLNFDSNQNHQMNLKALFKAKSEVGQASVMYEYRQTLNEDTNRFSQLTIGGSDLDLSKFDLYLPKNLNKNLTSWLKNTNLEGDLKKFSLLQKASFQDSALVDRTTQLLLNTNDMFLTYSKQWPPLTKTEGIFFIDDKGFFGDVNRGKLDDVTIGSATILFGDLVGVDSYTDRISIDGEIFGRAQDAVSTITNTPLAKNFEAILGWEYSGTIRSKLNLQIPLTNSLSGHKNRKYDIKSTLDNASMKISKTPILISGISGDVFYTNSDGFKSEFLEGVYKEKSFKMKFLRDHDIQKVSFNTMIEPSTISDFLDYDWDKLISGIIKLDGEVLINNRLNHSLVNSELDDLVTVTLFSDFEQNLIRLPAVAESLFDGKDKIMLSFNFNPALHELRVDYGDKTKGVFKYEDQDLISGVISYDQALISPKRGELLFLGNLEAFKYDKFETTSNMSDFFFDSQLTPTVDLKIGQLELGILQLEDLVLNAKPDKNKINIELRSEDISGIVQLSQKNKMPPKLYFSEFEISQFIDRNKRSIEDFDPRLMPHMDVSIRNLSFKNIALGELGFKLRGEKNKTVFKDINGEIFSLNIKSDEETSSNFVWGYDGKSHHSEFSGLISLGNVENLFSEFEVPTAIDSESGSLEFSLIWNEKPWEIKKDNVSGNLQIDLFDGSFYNTSTGANTALKLISLINFANWLKRLRLDFSDVVDENLPYDHLFGDISLKSGIASLDTPLKMIMPSGRMSLSGDIDVLNESADATLIATLPVATNLPWVVALMGSVPAAAGVFITSKIVEKQMNRLSSIRYSMQGEWDDLEVKAQEIFAAQP